MGIAPVHICLSVVVDPYGWVDVIPVFGTPNKRFAYRVFERTEGRVGNEHSDTIAVDRAIHIPLAVALDDLFCPGTVVALIPLEVAQ